MEVMKQLRQRAIRDLVEQRPIRTQQELAAALRDRGFRATQATISRDVAELGLGQRAGQGFYRLVRLRAGQTHDGDASLAARRGEGIDRIHVRRIPATRATSGVH